MRTVMAAVRSVLAHTAVFDALRQINDLEADTLKKTVDYVELQFAPELDQQALAEIVAIELLKVGIGVKITCHWPFRGTTSWALQTDKTRVVNTGLQGGA